ncbi:hypothetical protein [Larkinella terrae]|uniref:hypothetical protein n=1 Tax=Larkinella terrae TaxID=2025311 RepID=UPI0012AE194C|nr:hypothetical protein [Larkinella terrae]
MNAKIDPPKVGNIHWSWDGAQWIPCTIHRLTKSGKSFHCYNAELGYGSYLAIPNKKYRSKPEHKKDADSKPALFHAS